MQSLFEQERAWEKISSGEWSSVPVPASTVDSRSYPGHLSRLIKHYDNTGRHRATTHRIYDPVTNHAPHEHGKDIIIEETKYILVRGS